jgi:hypothetical protein
VKRWKEDVGRVALILLLPLLIIIKIVISFFEKPLSRSPEEMADLMEQSLAGDDMAWDRLISVPVADPRLEAIRKRCSRLETRAEINEVLRGFINELRTA